MTETPTSKIEKWAYPLKVDGAEVTDPQQYYDALAKAKTGFYPFGTNGLWHGGIHFDEATGLINDLDEVRCIADGEVVAYRIDESYQTSDYSETSAAVFSTGFVLVKHVLTPPVTNCARSTTPLPSLNLYSLYMHLLDWKTYRENSSLKRPIYWGEDTSIVKTNAPDSLVGLRVRSDNSSQSAVLGVLPRGTIVITKAAPANQSWLEVVSVSPALAGLESNTGWVFKKEMHHLGGDKFLIGINANDPIPEYEKGANLRDLNTGKIIGFLPVGTEVRVINGPGRYKKLVGIVGGEAVPKLLSNINSDGLGKIYADSLEELNEPRKPWGEVVVLPVPVKIKAGEVIGHVGKYQNNGEDVSKSVLHLEVFSSDDVPAFIEKCRPLGIGSPEDQRRLLKVHKGASQVVAHTDSVNASNPPIASSFSRRVGFNTIIPVDILERLPVDRKIKLGGSVAGEETYWWRIDDKFADEEGHSLDGWLHEQPLITTRHNSWEWLGFECLTESLNNVESLARHLHSKKALTEEETLDYSMQLSAATEGQLREWIHKTIGASSKKTLSVEEMRSVLSKYWFAQPISKLISKHESEWLWSDSKWSGLDSFMMESSGVIDPDWVVEKARIEKLSWWSQLANKQAVVGDGKVWHFHPIGLLSNFYIYRMRRDYDLGELSSHYETGGRGSITVSGGAGDAGGASYGAYQMTSQVKIKNSDGTITIINGGTVKRFLDWDGMPWKDEFSGLTPGSVAFTEKWKELVRTKGQ